MNALAAASIRTIGDASLLMEAANSFFWTLWRISNSADALALLQSWVVDSQLVDSLLLAQASMELEWRRSEQFLEGQALSLICWGSLARRGLAWDVWLYGQSLSTSMLAGRCLLRHAACANPWNFICECEFAAQDSYRKIAKLHADVVRFAEAFPLERPEPGYLLEAVDAHAQGVGQWLKVAGMDKAVLLECCLSRHLLADAGIAVEFGAFIGYTTVRLANRLYKEAANGACCVSLEVDHVHQVVARHLLDLAGLTPRAEVWNGQVRDLSPRVVDEFGAGAAFFVFMDHRGTRFHEDLGRLVRVGAPATSGHVVADNVLNPGGPVFAWSTCGLVPRATAWVLLEFMSSDREDWMVVIENAGRDRSRCCEGHRSPRPPRPGSRPR